LLLHLGEDNSQIMKHIKLFEDFVNEVKYTKLPSVGSIIDDEGNTYPMTTSGKPDLDGLIHISEIDPEDDWYMSLSDKDRKIVAKYESRITEAVNIDNLIDTLVNAMEDTDEKSFTKCFKEIGGSSKQAKTIFNDYWKVGAMDRFEWDTAEWTEWLQERGIK